MTETAATTDEALTPLVGTFHHQLDPKGRVSVPAQLRAALPAGSVVAPWPMRSLMIWTPAAYEREVHLFQRTAETFAQEQDFIALLSGNAGGCVIDSQGRLLLSPWQRGWAGIGDRAVFVGRNDGVEICSEETWLSRGGDLDPERFRRLYEMAWQRASAERSRS